MLDYIKRLLIAAIMALCVSLLFLGGKHTEASMQSANELQEEWIWPTDGVISDTYGTRRGTHKGIDIAGKLNADVLSVADGIVGKSYYSTSYGNVIFVNHPNNFVTVYAHLNKRLVAEGQAVKKGTKIGTMGRTGESTGVHLHFESHKMEWTVDKKNAIDPEILLGKTDVGVAIKAGISSGGEYVLEASTHLKGNQLQYIVQEGDTLTKIALKTNQTVEKLIESNHLKSDLILPRQILIIPE